MENTNRKCRNGHDRTVENTHTNPKGVVVCKICRRDSNLRAKEQERKRATREQEVFDQTMRVGATPKNISDSGFGKMIHSSR